jgi:acetyl esterase/lipase
LDAVAGYNYLVNVVGFEPANIIVTGDSAGGNLTLALTRYLVEQQTFNGPAIQIPPCPGHILLLSPWADLGSSHTAPGASSFMNVDSDYIGSKTTITINYGLRSFLGRHGSTAAELNPYISPASKHPGMEISFKGFPKTMIVAGDAEVLFDEIVTLRDRMAKDLGERVTYYQGHDAIHDYLSFGFFEPQRSDTLKAIAKWLQQDV